MISSTPTARPPALCPALCRHLAPPNHVLADNASRDANDVISATTDVIWNDNEKQSTNKLELLNLVDVLQYSI